MVPQKFFSQHVTGAGVSDFTGSGDEPDELKYVDVNVGGRDGGILGTTTSAGTQRCKRNSEKPKKLVLSDTGMIDTQLDEKLKKSHDKSLMQKKQQQE